MTPVSIPGYRISEELYNGSRTVVYRGYRDPDHVIGKVRVNAV